jgi:hypothetical protein
MLWRYLLPLILFLSEDGDTDTYRSNTPYHIPGDGNINIHCSEKPNLIMPCKITLNLEDNSPEAYHA